MKSASKSKTRRRLRLVMMSMSILLVPTSLSLLNLHRATDSNEPSVLHGFLMDFLESPMEYDDDYIQNTLRDQNRQEQSQRHARQNARAALQHAEFSSRRIQDQVQERLRQVTAGQSDLTTTTMKQSRLAGLSKNQTMDGRQAKFYQRMGMPLARQRNQAITNANSSKATIAGPIQPCESVFFWGGGKAGSTSLAVLLKHDYSGTLWDPHGDFVNLGKEVCWATKGGHDRWLSLIDGLCSQDGQHFALDACPRYTLESTAATIVAQYPRAKFLMLVRDPVDRLVSHLNDKYGWRANALTRRQYDIQKRRRRDQDGATLEEKDGLIERHAKGIANFQGMSGSGEVTSLSYFGRNLRNLVTQVADPFHQILIVRTEAMKEDSQQVINEVLDFLHAKPKQVQTTHANSGVTNRQGYTYQTISNQTRLGLQERFRTDVELLEYMLGKRFPWSWTDTSLAKERGVQTEFSGWKTTRVRSDLDLEVAKQIDPRAGSSSLLADGDIGGLAARRVFQRARGRARSST